MTTSRYPALMLRGVCVGIIGNILDLDLGKFVLFAVCFLVAVQIQESEQK